MASAQFLHAHTPSVKLASWNATTPCSGTPLETSKRKYMNPVLYTQLCSWICQLGVVSKFLYAHISFSQPQGTTASL